jgi:hypothetical protein
VFGPTSLYPDGHVHDACEGLADFVPILRGSSGAFAFEL